MNSHVTTGLVITILLLISLSAALIKPLENVDRSTYQEGRDLCPTLTKEKSCMQMKSQGCDWCNGIHDNPADHTNLCFNRSTHSCCETPLYNTSNDCWQASVCPLKSPTGLDMKCCISKEDCGGGGPNALIPCCTSEQSCCLAQEESTCCGGGNSTKTKCCNHGNWIATCCEESDVCCGDSDLSWCCPNGYECNTKHDRGCRKILPPSEWTCAEYLNASYCDKYGGDRGCGWCAVPGDNAITAPQHCYNTTTDVCCPQSIPWNNSAPNDCHISSTCPVGSSCCMTQDKCNNSPYSPSAPCCTQGETCCAGKEYNICCKENTKCCVPIGGFWSSGVCCAADETCCPHDDSRPCRPPGETCEN